MCAILIRIVIISRSQLVSESTRNPSNQSVQGFRHLCLQVSVPESPWRGGSATCHGSQRLNNRLHSEPQTQCLGESASKSRYLLGPAWFHLSLTLPPGSSHCVTCRTGHTRTAFPSARPGLSILHFLGNWCLLLTLACELAQ